MATSSHTEVPSGARPFPPFQKETFASQAVWLVITFVILYVLMSKVALPRVGGILEARKGKVAADLADAEKLKGQSDAAIAAYEKSLADARSRAQALAGEAHAKATAEIEAKRKALDAEFQTRLEATEKSIAATKTAAMTNVHSIASDATGAIIERLIGVTPPAPDVSAAVADVLKR
jgi:F-type H+-transporting ATPase subunit b